LVTDKFSCDVEFTELDKITIIIFVSLKHIDRYPTVKEFSLLLVVQTASGVHPTSYPMVTGGSSPGGKAAGA
jgi:hypothetical protein